MYQVDPFTYKKKVENNTDILGQLSKGILTDNGDHAELFGFNLLKFNSMKDKLDELNKGDKFKGFAPRWTLPMKLRNTEQPGLNTSCLLIAIDSRRETDLDLIPYFSKEIIGDQEIMVAHSALKHLNVTGHRKEKIEVFFDVLGLFQTFEALSGGGMGIMGGDMDIGDQID